MEKALRCCWESGNQLKRDRIEITVLVECKKTPMSPNLNQTLSWRLLLPITKAFPVQ